MAQFNALCGKYLARVEREDYRSALICSVIANVNRDSKRRPKPFMPQDFMLTKTGRTARTQTTDEMLAMAKAWNAALGGSVVEK